jgi:hypothetical protein
LPRAPGDSLATAVDIFTTSEFYLMGAGSAVFFVTVCVLSSTLI